MTRIIDPIRFNKVFFLYGKKKIQPQLIVKIKNKKKLIIMTCKKTMLQNYKKHFYNRT